VAMFLDAEVLKATLTKQKQNDQASNLRKFS